MNSRMNNIADDDLIREVAGDNISDFVFDSESIIMVAGVGGAGGNAVNHMQTMGITGVNFVVCNTDAKALDNCDVPNKIQMGPGLGAGNNPERGRELAIESEEQLRSLLETSGVQMLFIAAGMGGGTGTGASPVLAKLAHELGILTVAVVTFIFPKGNDPLQWMLYNVFGGGLMLGAIFMATDYATSPVTKPGQLIYGIGCGLLTVFIRRFGSFPEGVCYSILIMNCTTWLLDKYIRPTIYGAVKKEKKEAAK